MFGGQVGTRAKERYESRTGGRGGIKRVRRGCIFAFRHYCNVTQQHIPCEKSTPLQSRVTCVPFADECFFVEQCTCQGDFQKFHNSTNTHQSGLSKTIVMGWPGIPAGSNTTLYSDLVSSPCILSLLSVCVAHTEPDKDGSPPCGGFKPIPGRHKAQLRFRLCQHIPSNVLTVARTSIEPTKFSRHALLGRSVHLRYTMQL